MSTSGIRKNRELLKWIVAIGFGLTNWLAISALHFNPLAVAAGLSVAVGAIAFISTDMAVVALVVLASVPLLAVDALVGLIFLVVGLLSAQYLGGDEIPVVLIVALAFVLAALGPVWVVPVLAGYVLGATRGSIAALVTCALLEAAGIMLGIGRLGPVFAGSAPGVVSVADVPAKLLAFGWFGGAFRAIGAKSAQGLWDGITAVHGWGALLLQPVVWALAATVAGRFRRPTEDPRQLPASAAAALAGSAVAALGSYAVLAIFKVSEPVGTYALWAAVAFVLALAGAFVWDRAFAVVRPPAAEPSAAPAPRGMGAEDADVDELLRLIATAEDKIANQHTTHSVVMITDMKSFSRMTEEEGSFVTAKAVQRHRDLLLPVIESYHGRGKSTGGDGLIASFDSPEEAVCAARKMQQTLERHNAAHPREREILIRVGVADGEVVLDKGGRPFIGAALNLAARVMSLGDGGQILVTRDIASKTKAPGVAMVSHGEFELKNIAKPVEVLEVLWRDGQAPCDPHAFFAPKPASETPGAATPGGAAPAE
jgi:class 3 adenylate cyclase